MLDKSLNESIADYFRFYDENSWQLTNIKKNDKYIKADKERCLFYNEIENILRENLGKKRRKKTS